jgi:hypothetical protein
MRSQDRNEQPIRFALYSSAATHKPLAKQCILLSAPTWDLAYRQHTTRQRPCHYRVGNLKRNTTQVVTGELRTGTLGGHCPERT